MAMCLLYPKKEGYTIANFVGFGRAIISVALFRETKFILGGLSRKHKPNQRIQGIRIKASGRYEIICLYSGNHNISGLCTPILYRILIRAFVLSTSVYSRHEVSTIQCRYIMFILHSNLSTSLKTLCEG